MVLLFVVLRWCVGPVLDCVLMLCDFALVWVVWFGVWFGVVFSFECLFAV